MVEVTSKMLSVSRIRWETIYEMFSCVGGFG